MLKVCNAPRLACSRVVATNANQKHIHQRRYAKGLLNTFFVLPHLRCTHPQVCFEFTVDRRNNPPLLIRTHNLSRRLFGQIGQQDFRLTLAYVVPRFAQNHPDLTHVTQTQGRAVHPRRLSAIGDGDTGEPSSSVILARQMREKIFDGFTLNRFPRARDGEEKTPGATRIFGALLHLHLVLWTVDRLALNDDDFRPCWRPKYPRSLSEQLMLRLIRGMAFRPNQTTGYRQAEHLPTDHEQGKTYTEKSGIMLTLASLLSQWRLLTPFGLIAAITGQRQDAIFGWRQSLCHLIPPPVHEPMNVLVGRLKTGCQNSPMKLNKVLSV